MKAVWGFHIGFPFRFKLDLNWFDISRVGWGWRYPESGVGWVPAGVPREFEEESWRGEGKYIVWYNGSDPNLLISSWNDEGIIQ